MNDERPVGVRAATGPHQHRLVWASPGDLTLRYGDQVVIEEGAEHWLGQVVVTPDQILETVSLVSLPRVSRFAAEADNWPSAPERAGARLSATLNPPEA